MFPGTRSETWRANARGQPRSWAFGERRAAGRRGLKLAATDGARGGRSWPDPGRPSWRRRRHEAGAFGGASPKCRCGMLGARSWGVAGEGTKLARRLKLSYLYSNPYGCGFCHSLATTSPCGGFNPRGFLACV